MWLLTWSRRHILNTYHVRKYIIKLLWPRKKRTESWKINKKSVKYQIFVTHQQILKIIQNGDALLKTVLLHQYLGHTNTRVEEFSAEKLLAHACYYCTVKLSNSCQFVEIMLVTWALCILHTYVRINGGKTCKAQTQDKKIQIPNTKRNE